MWAREITDQCIVEDFFSRVAGHYSFQDNAVWFGCEFFVANQAPDYLKRSWPTQSNHTNRTAARRCCDCDYGIHRGWNGRVFKRPGIPGFRAYWPERFSETLSLRSDPSPTDSVWRSADSARVR